MDKYIHYVLCLVIIVNVNVTKYVPQNVKKYQFVAIRCVVSSSKCTKTRFRPQFCPGPCWQSFRRSPRTSSPLRRGTLPFRLDVFSVSISALYGASILRPSKQNSWLRFKFEFLQLHIVICYVMLRFERCQIYWRTSSSQAD